MSVSKLAQHWPEWKIGDVIGEGSFGKVYKATREEHGLTTFSAIKVISIPQNDSELASLRSEGWSEGATKTYFEGIVNDFISEIKLMESMKGTQNIVSVEDYKVLEKEDRIGWDIFIRMELLTSLLEHVGDKRLAEDEVIKLGLDILGALELCSKQGIIHRDIKPENIFISSFGYYKLGDFGIARELEKTAGSMSQKGTFNYIAPEVVAGRNYDATVDTYSLGIVLYRLLNNNRLPFTDPSAEAVQYQDRKNALDKRLKGENLPPPTGANRALAHVVLKACAFNPQDRYGSPQEFKEVLETAKAGGDVPEFSPTATDMGDLDESRTVAAIQPPAGAPDGSAPANPQAPQMEHFGKKKKSKKPLIMVACVLLAALLGTGGFFAWNEFGPGNPVNMVIAALERQEHAEAIAVFAENRDTMDMAAMSTALSRRLDNLRSEFLEESISYNAAQMELSTIRNWQIQGIGGQINETGSFIGLLNDSRVAFQLAESQFERGDFPAAISSYRLVSAEDPNFNKAIEGLNRAIDAHRERALSEAAAYAAGRNFTQAMFVLDNALGVLGNDAAIASEREAYRRDEVADRIVEAQALVEGNNFAGAMSVLRLIEAQNPGDADIIRELASAENEHVNFIVEQANSHAFAQRYSEAVRDLDEGLRLYPNNIMLTTTRGNVEAVHVQSIAAQATEHSDEEQFDVAIALLNEGLRTYPGNNVLSDMLSGTQEREINLLLARAEAYAFDRRFADAISLLQESRLSNNRLIIERINEYTLRLPRPFFVAAPFFEQNRTHAVGLDTRVAGNPVQYARAYHPLRDGIRGGTFTRHNLDGQFSTLSATIGRADGSERIAGTLTFSSGGQVLASFNIGVNDMPRDISVDLTDVMQLTIHATSNSTWSPPHIIISNAMIE
ncbi:MAG: protein kinase [Oscillospiraceae bacterium]|nr:protein kinase [Oscillospiraceae bacterium]